MQRLEVSGAVRPIYGSLGFKRLIDVARVSITVLLVAEIFLPPLFKIIHIIFLISGFRRYVSENCVLLGCYAASSGNLLPTFRDNLPGPIFRGQEFKRILYYGASSGNILPEFWYNL